MFYRLLLIVWLTTYPSLSSLAWSYVGPGVGITMLGTFWVFLSVFAALIVGMLVWPIRAIFRWLKAIRENKQAEPDEEGP